MSEIPNSYSKLLRDVAKESKSIKDKIAELQETIEKLSAISRSVWEYLDDSDIDEEDLEQLQQEIDDILEPPLEGV